MCKQNSELLLNVAGIELPSMPYFSASMFCFSEALAVHGSVEYNTPAGVLYFGHATLSEMVSMKY